MFTIQTVKNLQWENAEYTMFSCMVKYEEFNEEHPTGVNASDSYTHIKELWTKGTAEKYGVIADYVPPEITLIPVALPVEQPSTSGTQNL